ncbi:MAG: hypothetical protein AB8F65_04795 [Woeseiaceae bacterium]
MEFSPLLILLLTLGFFAGIWVGWLVHGERRQRADVVRLERQTEQVQSLESSNARLQRQLQELHIRIRDSADQHHRQQKQLKTSREALDEQLAMNRSAKKTVERAKELLRQGKQERQLLKRQLKMLIRRTKQRRDGTVDEATTTATLPTPQPLTIRSVKGIGPALAKRLEKLGITELEQLAEMDQDAIDELDQQLRFPGRIRRDRWVEQARDLIAGDSETSACA